uniref:Uncharacterized protein n=1 Tax=Anguilla anguilla TaxID=7936 RepID=A0A0E9QJA9_ANGAN
MFFRQASIITEFNSTTCCFKRNCACPNCQNKRLPRYICITHTIASHR